MTTAELDRQAQELRAQGLKYREIGEQMGETQELSWKRVNRIRIRELNAESRDRHRDHRRAYDRDRRRRIRGTCLECGGKMGIGTEEDGVCRDCRDRALAARSRQIEAWWAEGLSTADIAARLGWTENHAGGEIIHLREKGYNLPYRYTSGRRAGTKHPNLARGTT